VWAGAPTRINEVAVSASQLDALTEDLTRLLDQFTLEEETTVTNEPAPTDVTANAQVPDGQQVIA